MRCETKAANNGLKASEERNVSAVEKLGSQKHKNSIVAGLQHWTELLCHCQRFGSCIHMELVLLSEFRHKRLTRVIYLLVI